VKARTTAEGILSCPEIGLHKKVNLWKLKVNLLNVVFTV
jgi:hypothetical protein